MVFALTYCARRNCNMIQKNLKFEAEGRIFAKLLRSLEQFIQIFGRWVLLKKEGFKTLEHL